MEKPKKERTEAQKKATLAMLKARREKKSGLVKKNDDSSSEDESAPVEETKKERKPKKKVVVNSISIDIPPTPVAAPTSTPKIVEYLTKDDLQALRNDIAGMLRPAPPVVIEKNVVKKVKAPKKEIVEASEEEEEYVAPIKIKQERQQQKQESTRQVSRNLTGYDLLDALLKI